MTDSPWIEYVRMPYTVGVYLAVNAIPDAYVVVDGPDCLFFKAEFVHGTQDMHSTLLDAQSRHRVIHTVADTNKVVVDREAEIEALLNRVASQPDVGAVLVTALPMTAITGSQYDRLARAVRVQTGKPVLEVPARSLQADWLDGYERVLAALAEGLELAPPGESDEVAVVGILLDRTEADNLANVREITRILEQGLGLRVASVWPSNRTVANLAAAGRARKVVSLPYARRAARGLARRIGADLVEVDLPLGVRGSDEFVRAVGRATGLEGPAEEFIRREREACDASLRLARDHGLADRRIGLIGDPHVAPRLAEFVADLGAKFVGWLSTQYPAPELDGVPGPDALKRAEVDLVLTTTMGNEVLGQRRIPYLEFGFPSYGRHALSETPFLGYRGAVALAENLANSIRFFEDLRTAGLLEPARPFRYERGP